MDSPRARQPQPAQPTGWLQVTNKRKGRPEEPRQAPGDAGARGRQSQETPTLGGAGASGRTSQTMTNGAGGGAGERPADASGRANQKMTSGAGGGASERPPHQPTGEIQRIATPLRRNPAQRKAPVPTRQALKEHTDWASRSLATRGQVPEWTDQALKSHKKQRQEIARACKRQRRAGDGRFPQADIQAKLRQLQEQGEVQPEPAPGPKDQYEEALQKLQALQACHECTKCQWTHQGHIKGCKACLGQWYGQVRLTPFNLEDQRVVVFQLASSLLQFADTQL